MYRIEEKEEFNVVGIVVDTTLNELSEKVNDLKENFIARRDEVSKIVGKKNYGVTVELDSASGKVRYVSCCEVSDFYNVPLEMVMQIISESKYAVFSIGDKENVVESYEKASSVLKKKGLKKKNYWFVCYEDFELWIAIES